MRLVVAVGGNALLERGDIPEAEIQVLHALEAVRALAPLAADHDLVITHGNGPQVGLLAIESTRDPDLTHPFPLDVLGAQTQGMIGYFFLQAFENALPGREVASLICQTVVSSFDNAFHDPSKFVGSVYPEAEARRLAEKFGWAVRPDGPHWRRVVPSPEPHEIVELATIGRLLDAGALVICDGGGGIPVVRSPDGQLRGAEAVIDKDLTASLLARELEADSLVLLTDVPEVISGFGTEHARPLGRVTTTDLRAEQFPAGSMGPKIDAACQFVEATDRIARIGRLSEAADVLAGHRGTEIVPR
jgi:carbamate kinase